MIPASYESAPESVKRAFWDALAVEAEAARELERWMAAVESEDPVPPQLPSHRRSRREVTWDERWERRAAAVGRVRRDFGSRHPDKERFTQIPASVYVAALTGQETEGARVNCPHPDHEDRDPSCVLEGNRWHCFACGQGGSIFRLAGALWGIDHAGPGFAEICQRLEELFA